MDNFIFKLPKLPDDSGISKQKSSMRSINETQSRRDYNSTQRSLFHNSNFASTSSELQPIREGIQENLKQPFNSQGLIQYKSNNRQSFCDRFGFNGVKEEIPNERRVNLMNFTFSDNNAFTNSINQPSTSKSVFGGGVFGNNLNFSALRNNQHSSINSVGNSVYEKSGMYRVMDTRSDFQQRQRRLIEPSHSSTISLRNPSFINDNFPKNNGFPRSFRINDSQNEFNRFGFGSRKSTIPRDSQLMLNASQSAIHKQPIMNSFLSMSLKSMKEEVMNIFEGHGHILLQRDPEMSQSLSETKMRIATVIENAILNMTIQGNIGMTSLSNMIDGPQESTIHSKMKSFVKKPSSMFNRSPIKDKKYETFTSFEVTRVMRKLNEEDGSFEKETIIGNRNNEGKALKATEFQNSLNSTVVTRSASKLKVNQASKIKVQEEEKENSALAKRGNVASCRSKHCKSEKEREKSKDRKVKVDEMNKSRKCQEREKSGKKRSPSPKENLPVKVQRTDSEKNAVANENRVLCVTRSGRTVKKPEDIYNSYHRNDTFTVEKHVNKNEEPKKEETESLEPVRRPRVNKNVNRNKEPEKKEEEKEKEKPGPVRKLRERAKKKEKTICESSRVVDENEKLKESPINAKKRKINARKKANVTKEPESKRSGNVNRKDNSWGNDLEGLDDICLPDISIRVEEAEKMRLNLITMETPPLRNIRNPLSILESANTPTQSPDWQLSRHTRSTVKKFEKLRAQTFKTRIPKNSDGKKEKKTKNCGKSNKDVDAFVNWLGEREVRSPKKCSKVFDYIKPKRKDLEEDEDEDEDEDEGGEGKEEKEEEEDGTFVDDENLPF